jgi:hypothetical protein
MYYFISYYEVGLKYSKEWYGTLSYAPPATVLLYNDAEGYCIGMIDQQIRGIDYITEEEAMEFVNSADLDNPDIWAGEKLANRYF